MVLELDAKIYVKMAKISLLKKCYNFRLDENTSIKVWHNSFEASSKQVCEISRQIVSSSGRVGPIRCWELPYVKAEGGFRLRVTLHFAQRRSQLLVHKKSEKYYENSSKTMIFLPNFTTNLKGSTRQKSIKFAIYLLIVCRKRVFICWLVKSQNIMWLGQL